MDVRNILRRSVAFNRRRVAAVAGERRVTFEEAWNRALRFANGLLDCGLRPGEPVAVLEENGLPALDCYLGCAAGGFARVPLYARNARRSHVAMLANTNPRVLVVDEALAGEVVGIEDEASSVERVLVRGTGYEKWLAGQSTEDPDPQISENQLFIIRHTGGTTGAPKAVGISHRRWAATARDWFYPLPPPEPGDPILHVGPLSHASGYTLLPVFAAGGTQVLASGLPAAEVVELLQRERVAYAFLPPTLLSLLCRVPGVAECDWSAAKCFFTGAAPISEATIARAREVFGDRVLYQLFGQTEVMPVAAMGPREWFSESTGSQPLRACGRVLPWAEVEIRDEHNDALPVGEIGEIAVRCDGQFEGFYGATEDTAARLVDGWVLMGDVGRLDENGYLYLVDRKTDMIVSGGFNIYPGELENIISSHPAVLEVAVFGIPHEKWGETPMAVCSIDPDLPVSEREIIELVAGALGSYQKPSRVELTSEPLPKSAVGKLMRRALREPHWQDRKQRVAGA
jgi:acyl-CoA synthetase (AMP-forming)/AMP-acid ligase II